MKLEEILLIVSEHRNISHKFNEKAVDTPPKQPTAPIKKY